MGTGIRILFASPWGTYAKRPVDRDPVDYFYYRNTLRQGPFQLRSFQSWHPLHFLAQNVPVDAVVLENPGIRRFKREAVAGGYSAIAISFTLILAGRTLEMVRWIRDALPGTDIILGGYGTAVFKTDFPAARELKERADRICTGEGLAFFKTYLRDRWGIADDGAPPVQELLPIENGLFRSRLTLFRQLVFVGGLGCVNNCSFCATAHHFGHAYIPLFSGDALFDAVRRQAHAYPDVRSAVVYTEDFLADPANADAFIRGFEKDDALRCRPFFITVFASLRSIRRYTVRDLVRCGIGTIFVGVETFDDVILDGQGLGKRKGDAAALFAELHANGIATLGSFIVGWDGQTAAAARADARRFVALNPTFYQVVPLHPCPGTRLWDGVTAQNRLKPGYAFDTDGIAEFNFIPGDMETGEAKRLVMRTYGDLVAEGGPWPFRMVEILLQGYRRMAGDADPVLRERAAAYRRLLNPLLPLAFISNLLFRGTGFRKRYAAFAADLARSLPGARTWAAVGGTLLLPVVIGITWLGRFLFVLSPHGDQPRTIRRSYPAGYKRHENPGV